MGGVYYNRLCTQYPCLAGFSTMACRFANIKRFEDYEHKAVYLARISRKPGYMSWSVDCQGITAVLRI